MSVGGRAQTRNSVLRRAGLIAGILVLFAFVLLITGNWLLGAIFGVVAAAAIWVFLQLRTVH